MLIPIPLCLRSHLLLPYFLMLSNLSHVKKSHCGVKPFCWLLVRLNFFLHVYNCCFLSFETFVCGFYPSFYCIICLSWCYLYILGKSSFTCLLLARENKIVSLYWRRFSRVYPLAVVFPLCLLLASLKKLVNFFQNVVTSFFVLRMTWVGGWNGWGWERVEGEATYLDSWNVLFFFV